jgi:peptidoglycan hydrolase-like protein with peptidoglycan-binding domain
VRAGVRQAVAGAVVVGVAAGAWWAGRATLATPAQAEDGAADHVVVAVTDATVGRSYSYNATVTRRPVLLASNALPGVVTRVEATSHVRVGDELYAVAGVPVRAVVGETPFYRDLSIGTHGEDVRQLQSALRTLGHLHPEPDGTYGAATAAAVRGWQRATGAEPTGTVRLGELVAVPHLPAALALDDAVVQGAVLAGGEPAVRSVTATPTFAVVLPTEQAAGVPPDARVDVVSGATTWPAVVSGTEQGADGTVTLTLSAPDGGPVCGAECDALPAVETTTLTARVTVVPELSGPGVPVAAVRTDASGGTYVVAADGTHRPVTVRASGDGMAVVDGLTVGERVVVLDGSRAAHGAGADPGPAPTSGGARGDG